MTCGDETMGEAPRSGCYATLAQRFRYPESGVEQSVAHLAAFDPAVSADAVGLHESAYVEHERTAVLEELLRYYGYFGLRRAPGAELPDHLVVELEFMEFLCWRDEQAPAGQANRGDLLRAQCDFLSRHVLPLVRGMLRRRDGVEPHYRQAIELLADFVEEDFCNLRAALADGEGHGATGVGPLGVPASSVES